MTRASRTFGALAGFVVALVGGGGASAQAHEDGRVDAAGIEFYETRIRPLLADSCYACHATEKQRSGLRVDTRRGLLEGGERGAALVPGAPEVSLLLRAVRYDDDALVMPPKQRLADDDIEALRRWIEMGAPAPDEDAEVAQASDGGFDFEARVSTHWAYSPIDAHVEPPGVRDVAWPRDDVDRFVLARLEAAGLTPASEAEPRALVRRVTLLLTGLPPTPEEAEAFAADPSEDAYAALVDRLLASPRFGETWARHWLDLVRYADTKGHEFDYPIANAWEYRDYVIRAWNADVPYDEFVKEHIAGDLLPEPRRHPTEGFDESVLATGFWWLGEEVHSPVDIRGDQVERIANQIDVFSKAFLAQTVACARCHDHKFDPIRQTDYYALAGFLQSSSYRQVRFDASERDARIAAVLEARRAENARALASASEGVLRQRAESLAERLTAALDALPDAASAPEADEALPPLVRQLIDARLDDAHPLHALVSASDAKRAGIDVRATLASLAVRRAADSVELDRELARAQVLFDATAVGASDWIQDGRAFVPSRPGDASASWPPRLLAHAAAVADPTWSRLRSASGELHPGARWDSAGRMLRTPTVTLAHGKLAHLVRGEGNAFAVVDGHRLVHGPLHARTVRSWGPSPSLRWIEQDLSDYVGHRVHVEFASGTSGELELVLSVATERALPPPSSGTIELLSGDHASVELLARALANEVKRALGGLATGEVDEELAPLLAWFVDLESDAFGTRTSEPFDEQDFVARTAPALLDGSGVDEQLLIRGSHHSPAAEVPRSFLEALSGGEPLVIDDDVGSGRYDLARRTVDARNPLLARVQVNRLWMHVFGRGLVASVDDFGHMGEAPSHPELLDHLATRFVRGGWSNKRLLRTLVLSATYRMSTEADARAAEIDPVGRLLPAARVRRLTAEAIRDAILFVSGRLDERLYGKPVPIHLTEFLDGRGKPGASGPLDGDGRRSLYLSVRRNFPVPFLEVFDRPNPMTTAGRRGASNVPAQALMLMNDPLVRVEAERWAARVAAAEGDDRRRVERMVEQAFGRPARSDEAASLLAFVAEQAARHGADGSTLAWADLAHVLFNSKEFIYVE